MGLDMAEVWTEEKARIKSIEPEFAGSVISNYVTDEDKTKAIPVNERGRQGTVLCLPSILANSGN